VARRIHTTLEGMDVQALLKDTIKKVYQHPSIQVSHDATITNVTGYVGNFVTTVKSQGRVKDIEHGAAFLPPGL
jgi:heterodisulfide reductase subunit A